MGLKDYILCVFIMAIWGLNFSVVKLGGSDVADRFEVYPSGHSCGLFC